MSMTILRNCRRCFRLSPTKKSQLESWKGKCVERTGEDTDLEEFEGDGQVVLLEDGLVVVHDGQLVI